MHPAETIIPAAKVTMNYAEGVTKEIPADKFGMMPEGVNTNSPAFVIGHLSLYPSWIADCLGVAGVPAVPEGWNDLFKHGAECADDPDQSVYPGKDELMTYFEEAHNTLIEKLPTVDAAKFEEPNPSEGMRDMAPTLASMTNFMLVAHCMMHMGQLSAWRRCMGYGPCF